MNRNRCSLFRISTVYSRKIDDASIEKFTSPSVTHVPGICNLGGHTRDKHTKYTHTHRGGGKEKQQEIHRGTRHRDISN